ncbi:hypothetical protein [Aquabacterium fontiphilum]|uniref:hypothetical protein n=1 Tax=Aquabacterium fontiphilum TaxID=450365 RepID=UPI002ED5DB46
MIPVSSVSETLAVGKFLLSSLIKCDSNGRYAASVSVRSGRGSASHDRIYRFTPSFATREAASRYALAEGQRLLFHPHTHKEPA